MLKKISVILIVTFYTLILIIFWQSRASNHSLLTTILHFVFSHPIVTLLALVFVSLPIVYLAR